MTFNELALKVGCEEEFCTGKGEEKSLVAKLQNGTLYENEPNRRGKEELVPIEYGVKRYIPLHFCTKKVVGATCLFEDMSGWKLWFLKEMYYSCGIYRVKGGQRIIAMRDNDDYTKKSIVIIDFKIKDGYLECHSLQRKGMRCKSDDVCILFEDCFGVVSAKCDFKKTPIFALENAHFFSPEDGFAEITDYLKEELVSKHLAKAPYLIDGYKSVGFSMKKYLSEIELITSQRICFGGQQEAMDFIVKLACVDKDKTILNNPEHVLEIYKLCLFQEVSD